MTARLSFGPNRIGFPDPARLAESCCEAEAAGFTHLGFLDSQLRTGDFHVSRKYPAEGHTRHPWRTRTFWPLWFSTGNAHPSRDHVPYLHRRLEPVHFAEARGKVPHMPFVRVPYSQFIGRTKA